MLLISFSLRLQLEFKLHSIGICAPTWDFWGNKRPYSNRRQGDDLISNTDYLAMTSDEATCNKHVITFSEGGWIDYQWDKIRGDSGTSKLQTGAATSIAIQTGTLDFLIISLINVGKSVQKFKKNNHGICNIVILRKNLFLDCYHGFVS